MTPIISAQMSLAKAIYISQSNFMKAGSITLLWEQAQDFSEQ